MTVAASAPRRSQETFLSLPLLLGVVSFLGTVSLSRIILSDPDTYLHVAVGRWMIAHGALPVHDPFSHSVPGAPWIPHEWLAELVLALTYDTLGWNGLIFLSVLCLAASAALLARALLRDVDAFSVLIVVSVSIASILPHLLARPHIMALPLLVAWSAGLFHARGARRAPSLALLPLMLLWANLHGSFMFGVCLAAYLGGEAVLDAAPPARRATAFGWCGFLALTVVTALMTPHGVQGLLQPIRFTGMTALHSHIFEWMSPNFQGGHPLEAWLLGAMLLSLSLGLRLRITRLLLLLGLFHVALAHNRHIDLVVFVAPLVVAADFGPQLAARLRRLHRSAAGEFLAEIAKPAKASACAAAAGLLLVTAALSLRDPVERPDHWSKLSGALGAAETMGLSGPVFNTEAFGGYLIFSGVAPFIDGRIEMYGDAFLKCFADLTAGKEPALSRALDAYGITWTLLDPTEDAVNVLDHLPGWRRVYGDRYAVIHKREGAPPPKSAEGRCA